MLTKLTGILRNLADIEYEFETDDGDVYPIPPHIAEGVQYNYHIWLDLLTGEWGRLDEVAGSASLEKKHVLLLKTCSPNTDDDALEALRNGVRRVAREAEKFYRFYCRDIWDVRITADAVRESKAPWDNDWNKRMFMTYMNENEYPYGTFNYFHCWSHYGHASWCGLGQINNKYSWTQQSCGLHTIIHELGHNFGLHHATEGGREYGDKTCVMGGGGTNVPGLNAPHVAQLRRMARRPFATITRCQRTVLVPMETPDQCLFPEENVLAEVEGSERVWLSIRRKAGAAYDFRSPQPDKLHIHTRSGAGKTEFHGYISPGGDALLPNRWRCYYQKWDGKRAHLWLTNDGTEPPISDLPTFKNFPLESTELTHVYDGLWYNPTYNGKGLSILYGRPVWFGHNEGEAHFPRYDPYWRALNPEEYCFHALDHNNAILLTDLSDKGRDAIELKRLTLPADGEYTGVVKYGDWTLFTHEDIVNPDGVQTVVLIGNADGRWYYAQGSSLSSGLAVYASKNGRWQQENDIELEEVGTLLWEDGQKPEFTINGTAYVL